MTDGMHGMIVERQRLLIREAIDLRGLVWLAPVVANEQMKCAMIMFTSDIPDADQRTAAQ